MRMTKEQAINYCASQATIHWNTLRTHLEQDGLDAVEIQLMEHPSEVSEEFLLALHDEYKIEQALARELRETTVKEIESLEPSATTYLRLAFLHHLRDHYNNVLDDAADLADIAQVRHRITNLLSSLEEEFQIQVDAALEEQED